MTGPKSVPPLIDISVDFMDLADGRLWVRPDDVRPDFLVQVGRHAIVGDDGAMPRVARITAVDDEGSIELEVLAGTVESHAVLLTSA